MCQISGRSRTSPNGQLLPFGFAAKIPRKRLFRTARNSALRVCRASGLREVRIIPVKAHAVLELGPSKAVEQAAESVEVNLVTTSAGLVVAIKHRKVYVVAA